MLTSAAEGVPSAPVPLRRAAAPAAARPAPRRPRGFVPEVPDALVARWDGPGPRYTSYPPVPVWRAMDGGEYAGRLAALGDRLDREPGDGLALYVHLPFCAMQCLYCGCNNAVTNRPDVIDAYLARLAREADLVVAALGRGRPVARMHWGGGTPNHLSDAQLARAFAVVGDRFAIVPDAELTVEADPRLVTASQLATLRGLGFRRISFGVQDLDRAVQLAIGRRQPEPTVRAAVDGARAAGFEGVHVDLIYGLPLQTAEGFARTVDSVVDLAPDRVACFGYAHVPWMRPHQRRIADADLPGAGARVRLFREAAAALTGAGYRWVGLDHFAAAHDPLAAAAERGTLARDFMGYTPRAGARHLVGLGASAIGFVDGCHVQNAARLGDWQRAVDAGHLPAVRGHPMSADDRRRAAAVSSLLCGLEVLQVEADALLGRAAPERRDELARLVDDGLVERGRGVLRVTPRGRFFLRRACMLFDAYLPDAPAAEADAGAPRFSRAV